MSLLLMKRLAKARLLEVVSAEARVKLPWRPSHQSIALLVKCELSIPRSGIPLTMTPS